MASIIVISTLALKLLAEVKSVALVTQSKNVMNTLPVAATAVNGRGNDILETLWLDLWHATGFETSYEVRGALPITTGQMIIVSVQGTYSAWNKDWWASSSCKGVPEASPQYPTQGLVGEDPNGPVGLDAQYAFAAPGSSSYCTRGDRHPYSSESPFQISTDGGTNWLDAAPLNAGYSAYHFYEYKVQSQGVPLEFRVKDHSGSDNYGRLRIIVGLP